MKISTMIVEDDELMRHSLNTFFSWKGHQVLTAAKGQEGMTLYRKNKPDLVLLDLNLPDGSGLDFLQQMKEIDNDPIILIITAFPEIKIAVSSMKAGAFDYITKPFELDELDTVVDKAIKARRLPSRLQHVHHRSQQLDGFSEILGSSPAIQRVKELITLVAQASHTPVLIQGESGTGKELVANAIHYASERANQPLVKVNCSAIPSSLMESELFGYEKGAFTGAQQVRPGLFELADGGSLFLDEVGDLDLLLQPKLLRVIEGHPFRKLGGQKNIKSDVRIIAATHRNLPTLVKQGDFREDLYYRLKVVVIDVPPLRERGEDVLLLADRFLHEIQQDLSKEKVQGFSDEAQNQLLSYSWPGNVRELRNTVERALILSQSKTIELKDLPKELRNNSKSNGSHKLSFSQETDLSLKALERTHIHRVLDRLNWNKSQAARSLGIARSTLEEKIKQFGWRATTN